MGALVSIIYIVMVSIFLYSKCATLWREGQITVRSNLNEDALDQNYKFTNKEGLFIAAALTAYDNETEEPTDLHKYGEIIFEKSGWGDTDEGFKEYTTTLSHRACTESELGLSSTPGVTDASLEYPIS